MTFAKMAFTTLILACVLNWPSAAPAGAEPAHERLAQAPAPSSAKQPPTAAQPAARTTAKTADRSIGSVATVQGRATVTRSSATRALNRSDSIFMGDQLQTGSNGTLGVTFDDATTFTLTPNSRIEVDSFVYQEGGASNAANFNVVHGTVAFVASKVGKTGNMQIGMPNAALGIRGTTGIVEIASSDAAAVKLYPDADRRVGRIEVFGRDGTPLGVLSLGATGLAIQPAPPGAPQPFSAVPLQITAQQAERDLALLRRTFQAQTLGRRILERRDLQRSNRAPDQLRPRTPQRLNQLPPAGGLGGPTLLQPGPPIFPQGSPTLRPLPGTLPPAAPPDVPQFPLPGTLPPVSPPGIPTVPRLPGRL